MQSAELTLRWRPAGGLDTELCPQLATARGHTALWPAVLAGLCSDMLIVAGWHAEQRLAASTDGPPVCLTPRLYRSVTSATGYLWASYGQPKRPGSNTIMTLVL